MSLFVGLNGTAEELGVKPQNIWMYNRFVIYSCDFTAKDRLIFVCVTFFSCVCMCDFKARTVCVISRPRTYHIHPMYCSLHICSCQMILLRPD